MSVSQGDDPTDSTPANVPPFLTDSSLSLKAKGLLALIAAMPQHATSIEVLGSLSSDGGSATREAIKEALDAGHLRRLRVRRPNGTMGPGQYVIAESESPGATAPLQRPPRGWAYAISDPSTDYVKIGCSVNPRTRLRGLQTGWPSTLNLLWSMPGGAPLESYLHERFRARRVRGEWFDFSGVDAVSLIQNAAEQFRPSEASQ